MMKFLTDFSLTLVITATVLAIAVVAYFKWAFSYWERKKVPILNPTIPFGDVGQYLSKRISYAEQFLVIYEQIKAKGLKHAGIYVSTQPVYIPLDPEIIKHIVQKDFEHFVNHGVYINEKSDPLGTHLFSLRDAKWKDLRRKLTPTFTSGKMKMMFPTLANCAVGLQRVIDQSVKTNMSIEMKDILDRFTMDIIGSVGFGIDCNCLEDPDAQFAKYGKEIFRFGFWETIKANISFIVPEHFLNLIGFKLINANIERFFMKVVRDTVEHREKNHIFRKDFLHLLLQLKNRGKLADDGKITDEDGTIGEKGLTMNELSAQVFLFFAAGFETSSTTIAFAFYELAQNQHIQDKLRQEIHDVLAKNQNELSYEAIMQMTYMNQVLDETMRKWPALPVLIRQCNLDYNIPTTNGLIEKGVLVGIPTWGLHMDPQYYPNPTKFDPERFTEENKKTRPAFTFLPFGEGPRQCIALRLGVLQSKVGLVALLKNYRIRLDENRTQVPLKYDKNNFILAPNGGVWLHVEKIYSN